MSRSFAPRRGGRGRARRDCHFGVSPDHPAIAYGYIHPPKGLVVDPKVGAKE
jgi:hypothetical protein